MEIFNAPREVIEQLRNQKIDAPFEVLEENWETVELFLRCGTQWRVQEGVIRGLDYCAVESVARMLKIEDIETVFLGVQIMERAALMILNKKRSV